MGGGIGGGFGGSGGWGRGRRFFGGFGRGRPRVAATENVGSVADAEEEAASVLLREGRAGGHQDQRQRAPPVEDKALLDMILNLRLPGFSQ